MNRSAFILCVALLIFPACAEKQAQPPSDMQAAPVQPYIIIPQDIPAEYEVVGQVELSSEKAATVSELYEKLGNACAKMGGDLVINVEAGRQSQDTSKIHSLPPHYGMSSPRFSPDIDVSYTWGKGTIIRLKNEEQRKAYFEEMHQGDVGDACAIIGVAPPK